MIKILDCDKISFFSIFQVGPMVEGIAPIEASERLNVFQVRTGIFTMKYIAY